MGEGEPEGAYISSLKETELDLPFRERSSSADSLCQESFLMGDKEKSAQQHEEEFYWTWIQF